MPDPVDLLAALERAIHVAKAAQEAQAAADHKGAATPKPPRVLPPKDQGDVVLAASSYTLRVCVVCDRAIHVGSPLVTHWPTTRSRVSHPYHPICWENRS